jgi:hypothetical protein
MFGGPFACVSVCLSTTPSPASPLSPIRCPTTSSGWTWRLPLLNIGSKWLSSATSRGPDAQTLQSVAHRPLGRHPQDQLVVDQQGHQDGCGAQPSGQEGRAEAPAGGPSRHRGVSAIALGHYGPSMQAIQPAATPRRPCPGSGATPQGTCPSGLLASRASGRCCLSGPTRSSGRASGARRPT